MTLDTKERLFELLRHRDKKVLEDLLDLIKRQGNNQDDLKKVRSIISQALGEIDEERKYFDKKYQEITELIPSNLQKGKKTYLPAYVRPGVFSAEKFVTLLLRNSNGEACNHDCLLFSGLIKDNNKVEVSIHGFDPNNLEIAYVLIPDLIDSPKFFPIHVSNFIEK
jgi:hypothetical protein